MKTVCWPVVEKMVQSAQISYLIEMQPLGTENNITDSLISYQTPRENHC